MSGREVGRLLVYAAVIFAISPILASMLARGWFVGAPAHAVMQELQVLVLLPRGPAGTAALSALLLGVYASALVLYTVDFRRRVQGLLLAAGSAIGVVILAGAGLLIPSIAASQLNVVALGFGAAVPVFLERGSLAVADPRRSLRGYLRRRSGRPIALDRAQGVLFGLLVAIVGVGLVNGYLTATASLFDVLAAVVFVVVLRSFLETTPQTSFQVLGPKQAGKSMFLLGLYQERMALARERGIQTPPRPSEGMKRLVAQLHDYVPERDGWPTTANPVGERGLHRVWFEFVAGTLFPVNVRLTAIDHGGEHLTDLADRLRPTATDGGKDTYDYDDWEVVEDAEEDEGQGMRDRLERFRRELQTMGGSGDADGEAAAATPAEPEPEPVEDEPAPDEGRDPEDDDEEEQADDDGEPDERTPLLGRVRRDGAAASSDASSEAESTLTLDAFYGAVIDADTLVLLIDCERLVGAELEGAFTDPSPKVGALDTIVQETRDRRVLLVATKADHLFEEFDYGGYNYDLVDDVRGYAAFRRFVTERLREDQSVEYLLQDAGVSQVYPVYFTTRQHAGRRIPDVDEHGHPERVGFRQVLKQIEATI